MNKGSSPTVGPMMCLSIVVYSCVLYMYVDMCGLLFIYIYKYICDYLYIYIHSPTV